MSALRVQPVQAITTGKVDGVGCALAGSVSGRSGGHQSHCQEQQNNQGGKRSFHGAYLGMLLVLSQLLLLLTGCADFRHQGAVYEPSPASYSMVRTIAVLPVRCPTNGLYRLEYSGDLIYWTPIARNCIGTGTNTMTIQGSSTAGFLRLVKQKDLE